MIRTFVRGSLIAGVLVLGLVAQAGAHLLEFASPTADQPLRVTDTMPYREAGPHSVGVRGLGRDGFQMKVWYPAAGSPPEGHVHTYSYGIKMTGPDRTTAIATFRGQARPGAPFDRSSGRYPLVVLSHGFAISADSYGWLAEHLASYGTVVVAPEHREALDPIGLWRSTFDRPRDIRTVLSHVDEAAGPGGALAGLVDAQTVAVVGHSYGGYTALASAGARVHTGAFEGACESAYAHDDPLVFLCDALLPHLGDVAEAAGLGTIPEDLWPSWAASRVDAAVALAGEAAMFGEDGLAEVAVPMMAIGGTADTDSPFEWGTELAYDGVSSDRKVEIALEGAGHLVFAGDCASVRRILSLVSLGFCSDEAWDRARAHDVTKHYVTAFVLAELGNDEAAAMALAPGHTLPRDLGYRAEGY